MASADFARSSVEQALTFMPVEDNGEVGRRGEEVMANLGLQEVSDQDPR